MALHIPLASLLEDSRVEHSRIEFKEGDNPEAILKNICAFANDFFSQDGGFVIIGAAEDENGVFDLNNSGLQEHRIEKIQNKLIGLTQDKIRPQYSPHFHYEKYKNKHFIVVWCPRGDNRPYSVPEAMKGKTQRQYYIRHGNRTRLPKSEEMPRLLSFANQIPFEDRACPELDFQDIDLLLVRDFLDEIDSGLSDEIETLSRLDLFKKMHLIAEPKEANSLRNLAALFFHRKPQDIERFRNATTVILQFDDIDRGGDTIQEKIFDGPLHVQQRSVLDFISTHLISGFRKKLDDRPEVELIHSYPYKAVEEVISNAIFHRSYDPPRPIEVAVFKDRMEILSYPGPLPPIGKADLEELSWENRAKLVARHYRNGKIGEYLKLLGMTEGYSTGISKIFRAFRANGSPMPKFETDDERSYFLVTLYKHKEA